MRPLQGAAPSQPLLTDCTGTAAQRTPNAESFRESSEFLNVDLQLFKQGVSSLLDCNPLPH